MEFLGIVLHNRVYADGLESSESESSSESGHMSLFTVNLFLAGVHHLDDSRPSAYTLVISTTPPVTKQRAGHLDT